MTIWPSRSQTLIGAALALPIVLGAFHFLIELSLDSGILGAGRSLTTFERFVSGVSTVVALPALPTLAELADIGPQPLGIIMGAAPGALLWGWLGALGSNWVRLCSRR